MKKLIEVYLAKTVRWKKKS